MKIKDFVLGLGYIFLGFYLWSQLLDGRFGLDRKFRVFIV